MIIQLTPRTHPHPHTRRPIHRVRKCRPYTQPSAVLRGRGERLRRGETRVEAFEVGLPGDVDGGGVLRGVGEGGVRMEDG